MKKLWDDFKEFKEGAKNFNKAMKEDKITKQNWKEVAEKHIKEAEINRKATDEIRNEKKCQLQKNKCKFINKVT